MDGSFFAFAVLGAALGWFLGDFQRQARYRRDARANLALSVARSNERANARALAIRGTNTTTNGDGNADGPAWTLGSVRDGAARRRAVRGDHHRDSPGAAPVGRDLRSTDEAALVPAGGFDFDGD